VAPEHAEKLRDILGALDMSRVPQDMNLPGFKLHQLKGSLKGHYAV
jgi:toxin HigB-1